MNIKKDRDPLGTRIKENYENRNRYSLPRRTYTIIRLDGCHFHSYTKNLNKPFDKGLYEDIDNSIIAIMPQIQGAVFAYTQSDEISILLTDFATNTTDAWFDGNLQKMCSVSSSMMTAEFNRHRLVRACGIESGDKYKKTKLAYFDSRVFTIPDRTEVMNYFVWRNQDCSRNSVSMLAQQHFSHGELQSKNTPEMHEMLHKINVNWATDLSDGEKNGRLIVKEFYYKPMEGHIMKELLGVPRSSWTSTGAWKFTEDKDKLLQMIPQYE